MKIRSKDIADQLMIMGWSRVGSCKVRGLPALRLRRPQGVSRRLEREVMILLLAWQAVVHMAHRRDIEWRSSYCPLGHAARSLISTAIDLIF